MPYVQNTYKLQGNAWAACISKCFENYYKSDLVKVINEWILASLTDLFILKLHSSLISIVQFYFAVHIYSQ